MSPQSQAVVQQHSLHDGYVVDEAAQHYQAHPHEIIDPTNSWHQGHRLEYPSASADAHSSELDALFAQRTRTDSAAMLDDSYNRAAGMAWVDMAPSVEEACMDSRRCARTSDADTLPDADNVDSLFGQATQSRQVQHCGCAIDLPQSDAHDLQELFVGRMHQLRTRQARNGIDALDS